jgi:hypothetical protein
MMCSEPTFLPADWVAADPQLGTEVDHEHSTCPAPLDCGDLAKTFRMDKAVFVHLLKTLTPAQLTLQALAYAAYLNQLHGLDLDMDDLLTSWQRGLGFDTR